MRWPLLITLLLMLPLRALAVPQAEHVDLKLLVQRMNVNDYSIRKQFRVELDIATQDPARLEALESARLIVTNPAGVSAKVRPYRIYRSEPRFKALRAEVVFKLVEDTGSKQRSNVPRDYFGSDGPYGVRLDLPWTSYSGRVSFGAPIALRITQEGQLAQDFVLTAARPIELATLPASFGPVYYKRQDVSNVFFQLANMDNALSVAKELADFRAPVESPQYFFQLRAGKLGTAATQLIDPTAYITGAQHGLIRSDRALTPMVLPAAALDPGQNLLVDFSRAEALRDVFRSSDETFSTTVTVRERIAYVFELR